MDSTTAALAKLTAMHGAHQVLGAEFLYRDGWKLPSHYSSSDEEVSRAINGGGILDISPIGKLSFQGAQTCWLNCHAPSPSRSPSPLAEP